MSACGHQFVGEAVCEHCGAYEREHFLHRIAELTRELGDARRERDRLRAAVAAWLRDGSQYALADAIERGEHDR